MPTFAKARRPAYLPALRDAGVQGRVLIELIVRPDGLPDTNSFHVRATPNDGLAQAALTALGASTFTPGRLRGRAVYAKISVPYDFRLDHD
jgi:TonB family protein